MKFLIVKVAKNNEYTYEQALSLFSSLDDNKKQSITEKLGSLFDNSNNVVYSFNIISSEQQIYFVVGVPEDKLTHVTNQILAQYTNADISTIDNLQEIGVTDNKVVEKATLKLTSTEYLPFKNISEFTDVDPLSSVLSAMSRSIDPNALFWIQILITPAPKNWQYKALSRAGALKTATETTQPSEASQQKAALIQEKIKHNGFKVQIRLITNSIGNMHILKNSFHVYAKPGGNSLKASSVNFLQRNKFTKAILEHQPLGSWIILNNIELATLWHMPNKLIDIPNIVWGKRIVLDTPPNLPIADNFPTKEERVNLTFFAKARFKNKEHVFGIKKEDRLRHIYVVGKTGTGKSTFLENLAIEDIRKGAGLAVLDPHGETIDHILQYIPKNRINDVCYFNPSDPEYAYPLNMLEVPNKQQRELLVSGVIAIFHKIYGQVSWGPRLEYILRNAISTLVLIEGTTLVDIIRILSESQYRKRLLSKIDDPIILRFWNKEFNVLDDRQRNEQISSILNKVGQFITSPLIRNIVNWPKSKVKISEIMDNQKILLCDLSQGKIGEDNATLLGSMLITQIQVAAMNRAYQREEDRVPFYLYVDEFQNFATSSFSKILSEARKYKLGLTMANQYISQIDEDVMAAILGNIGTITTFTISADDSEILAKEFGSQVTPEDLTKLDRYQMVTMLAIDGRTSEPFTSVSLPPPKNISGHLDKIIEHSRRTYGVKIKDRNNNSDTSSISTLKGYTKNDSKN